MRRAFIFLTALTMLVFSVADAIAKGQKPSEEMIRILIHYKSGPNDLDVKGLTHDQNMNFPSKEEKPEYEVYRVPHPDGVAECVNILSSSIPKQAATGSTDGIVAPVSVSFTARDR